MLQWQDGVEPVENMVGNRFGQLDVLEALLEHVRWKNRLSNYIEGRGEEKLDPEMVRRDSDCVLGQWLQGIGGILHGESLRFLELIALHDQFHRHAAEVVRAVDRGERDRALNLFQHGSYAKSSRRINALLARISLEFDN